MIEAPIHGCPYAGGRFRGDTPYKEPQKMCNRLPRLLIFTMVSLIACAASADGTKRHNYKPDEGYVPDAETAIAIAVAVWTPIYGKEKIEKQEPYRARFWSDKWYVQGTLNCAEGRMCKGGVARIEISKDSGCILRVSHGK